MVSLFQGIKLKDFPENSFHIKSDHIPSFSPYSVRIWENTDQKISEYGHFSRSVLFLNFSNIVRDNLDVRDAC